VALGLPASAGAHVLHTVAASETLTSIAAADGLSVASLAAVNGLSPESQLLAGATLVIPPRAAATTSGSEPAGDDAGGETGSPTVTGYLVQPGDTLSAIAARVGTSVSGLAAANGLEPSRVLLAGTVLRVSGLAGASSGTNAAQQVGSAAPPYPTAERVSAGEVGAIAAVNGVPASLAAAIGWQESGFNNALVSPADARGVMQIVPGTWAWVQQHLAAGSLAPASAWSNVRGGVLLLRSLLDATGGDPALAAAGYYQGLASVRSQGMYASTRHYVANVLALRQRFGGP